jgi:dolichyl-phosphate-mannose--protein O-mannosyl transferase
VQAVILHPVAAVSGLPSGPDGRVLGILCGLGLAAFVAWSITRCIKSIPAEERDTLPAVLSALGFIAILKLGLMPFFPGLGIDVGSYQAWASRMCDVGPGHVYQTGYFLDYPPGYLYALWGAGWFAGLLGLKGAAFRIAIESPSLVADFALALITYVLAIRLDRRAWALAAMLIVALNPALLYDTVIWGQSDSVPALLILMSLVCALDSDLDLSWGVAGLAVLVKPQALLYIPVLALWTLVKSGLKGAVRGGLAFLLVAVVVIAPFQLNQPWGWIFSLYRSTAAYYHETSVNAFNFLALIGGLREPDSTSIVGLSFFTVGLALLGALYGFIAWMLARRASAEIFLCAVSLALFGSFMVGPRMHERYLYPALVLMAPLTVGSDSRTSNVFKAIFLGITVTFLFNLMYVKQILEAGVFFSAHDGPAMMACVINSLAMSAAIWCAATMIGPGTIPHPASRLRRWTVFDRFVEAVQKPASSTVEAEVEIPPWHLIDTITLSGLLAVAAVTRFWRIGLPAEIVFDEVHFVGQAHRYLHAEAFLDPHPPLAKLLIATSIAIFGDHSWAWRIPNALIGITIVAITYMLARRMFSSRLAAAFAAACVVCDGMFIVDSRIAVLDIVYLTFAAWSYLLLFRFIQTANPRARRRILTGLGATLGFCLSAKLLIPEVTFLLIVGFLVFTLMRVRSLTGTRFDSRLIGDPLVRRQIIGSLALCGGIAAMVYLCVFIPHFWLGWWGGIGDLVHYYGQIVWYEKSVASATHPYAAPWWSWPLMLRPIAYWQNFPGGSGPVATIWGGGNPVLWWGAFTAMTIVGIQALERRDVTRCFMITTYLAYLLMWVPIGRTLFLYHYMPAVYIGFLALAAVLDECWSGRAQPFEHLALLVTLAPVFLLGLGLLWGTLALGATLSGYIVLLARQGYGVAWAGRWVCATFAITAFAMFLYYLPVWTGLPINRAGYYARMWLQGPGLRNWI